MTGLSLSNLKAPKGRKRRKTVGRGNASGHGTYSTRGQKGQKARTGTGGLKLKGLRQRLLPIPKLGGFSSIHPKAAHVNLRDLGVFNANAVVSPKSLVRKGLVSTPRFGVKILGKGEIDKPLTIQSCTVSASAREKIEKAGGSIK